MAMKFLLAAAAAGLMICAAPGAALAASPADQPESAEDRAACTDDAFNHCGEFVPDRDKVYTCLVRKVKLISPACRKVVTRPTPRR